ncbi:MAG: hypothetical protein EZS28_020385, partial [Streblomastix strix]
LRVFFRVKINMRHDLSRDSSQERPCCSYRDHWHLFCVAIIQSGSSGSISIFWRNAFTNVGYDWIAAYCGFCGNYQVQFGVQYESLLGRRLLMKLVWTIDNQNINLEEQEQDYGTCDKKINQYREFPTEKNEKNYNKAQNKDQARAISRARAKSRCRSGLSAKPADKD